MSKPSLDQYNSLLREVTDEEMRREILKYATQSNNSIRNVMGGTAVPPPDYDTANRAKFMLDAPTRMRMLLDGLRVANVHEAGLLDVRTYLVDGIITVIAVTPKGKGVTFYDDETNYPSPELRAQLRLLRD